jgi:hypothetical protein
MSRPKGTPRGGEGDWEVQLIQSVIRSVSSILAINYGRAVRIDYKRVVRYAPELKQYHSSVVRFAVDKWLGLEKCRTADDDYLYDRQCVQEQVQESINKAVVLVFNGGR